MAGCAFYSQPVREQIRERQRVTVGMCSEMKWMDDVVCSGNES